MDAIFCAVLIIIIAVWLLIIGLAFFGVYWGIVTSANMVKQQAEARQEQKRNKAQRTQNPTTSLLRASNANINTPYMLVRPAMAEADANLEELLRPIDKEASF